MTYRLMLIFVFVTLFAVGVRWLSVNDRSTLDRAATVLCSIVWAALGTFFFANFW